MSYFVYLFVFFAALFGLTAAHADSNPAVGKLAVQCARVGKLEGIFAQAFYTGDKPLDEASRDAVKLLVQRHTTPDLAAAIVAQATDFISKHPGVSPLVVENAAYAKCMINLGLDPLTPKPDVN